MHPATPTHSIKAPPTRAEPPAPAAPSPALEIPGIPTIDEIALASLTKGLHPEMRSFVTKFLREAALQPDGFMFRQACLIQMQAHFALTNGAAMATAANDMAKASASIVAAASRVEAQLSAIHNAISSTKGDAEKAVVAKAHEIHATLGRHLKALEAGNTALAEIETHRANLQTVLSAVASMAEQFKQQPEATASNVVPPAPILHVQHMEPSTDNRWKWLAIGSFGTLLVIGFVAVAIVNHLHS